MKKIAFFVILSLTLISCKNSKCEDILCFTPPPDFTFELVDKTTGENLFENGNLLSEDIKVLDEENKNVPFQFISENNLNSIYFQEIGWNLGLHTYTLTIGNQVNFDLVLEMQEKHENCCTFFKVLKFDISNYEYEQSNSTGIYKIKIG